VTAPAETAPAAVAAPRASALAAARLRNPVLVLGGLVAASFLVRLGVGWLRQTPLLFPDEYIYGELGRSIAETGRPLIRGHAAHFPALLQPLLTSPAWLASDVDTSYRILQAIQALAMSLVAVPVFLLARRLRLSQASALAVAALSLAVPDFLYAAGVLAEPFAYPLALGAIAAGVAALERPAWRPQALFLAFALAATLARVQFVVLAPAYLGAVLLLGLRERGLRRVLREQRLPLGSFALAAAGLAVVGLGYYSDILHGHLVASTLAGSAASNLLVLGYAAGWVIVPGALLGLALAFWKPAARAELAFAALTTTFLLGLLGQTALYSDATHERYTFYVVPLLALAFALYARRGWPYRLQHGLLAAVLAAGATLMPLSELGLRGEVHTPVLIAVHWLTLHASSPGLASVWALLCVLVGTVAVVAASRFPRVATKLALGFAAALMLVTYALSSSFMQRNSEQARSGRLGADRSFVDAHRLGPVSFLAAWGSDKTDVLNQLFWNRSVDRMLLLPGAQPADAFDTTRLHVAADGTLHGRGRTIDGPLLVDAFASYAHFRGARRIDSGPNYDLWVPEGTPRLDVYLAGRYRDGWMGQLSRLDVWADGPSSVRLPLLVPAGGMPTTLKVKLAGGRRLSFALRPGTRRTVVLPVCAAGAWHADLGFDRAGISLGRLVSARAGTPVLTRGAACDA
jgi:hypothetical protein